jgi:hypothetical protein
LEFSERFGLIKNNSIEWKEIKTTNTIPIDERLLYFEVVTAKFQRACNVLFLNKILATNLNSKPIGSISKEINNTEIQQLPKTEALEIKTKKLSEKWHALHYYFELAASNSLQKHIDPFGGFIGTELTQEGKKRCGTTGQSFYKEYIKIDITNPIQIERVFGKNWKETIVKLSENDQITIDYINKIHR